jgi:hypothetical protein
VTTTEFDPCVLTPDLPFPGRPAAR